MKRDKERDRIGCDGTGNSRNVGVRGGEWEGEMKGEGKCDKQLRFITILHSFTKYSCMLARRPNKRRNPE